MKMSFLDQINRLHLPTHEITFDKLKTEYLNGKFFLNTCENLVVLAYYSSAKMLPMRIIGEV